MIGDNPHYSQIKHPPLHPHCQCTIVEVLKPEYGGPVDPKSGATLQQPQKGLGAEYKPPAGTTVPKPEPDRPKPVPTKPADGPPKAPKPPEPGTPILPDRPIAERLKAYTAGDEKVAKIVEIHNAADDRINVIAAERAGRTGNGSRRSSGTQRAGRQAAEETSGRRPHPGSQC